MQPILLRTIEFRDAFGGRVRLSVNDYMKLLHLRGTQTYLVCVLALLVAMDAPGLIGAVNPLSVLCVWAFALVCFLICHGLALVIVATCLPLIGSVAIPGVIISTLALILPVGLSDLLVRWMSGGNATFAGFPHVLFYLLATEMFILIYMRYVRPTDEAASEQAQQASDDAALEEEETTVPPVPLEERKILIGAEPVALSKLRHIQAREHHVHVVLDEASLTHRARLSDIIAQTDREDGIQPHRSWWVSTQAAQKLERDGQKHILALHDGTKVPVARSRLEDVRDWMSENA